MSKKLQVFYTLFSSILIALAIPNEIFKLGFPFFAFFALVPFFLAISFCKNFSFAFFLGYIHAFFVHLFSSFWLGNFRDFAIFTLGASAIGTGFIEGAVAWFIFLPFLADFEEFGIFWEKTFLNRKIFLSIRPIYLAFCYVFYEFLKSTGFLAYPWGTLSSSSYNFRFLIQIADFTGPCGVTFLFALFSAIFAEWILFFSKENFLGGFNLFGKINLCDFYQPKFKNDLNDFDFSPSFPLKCTTFFYAALFLLAIFYGIFQCKKIRVPKKFFNVIIVQQNLDPWSAGMSESILKSIELTEKKLLEQKALGKKVDAVVWSEGILSRRLPEFEFFYRTFPNENPLVSFIKKCDVPFIIGGNFSLSDGIGNGALFFEKSGDFLGAYCKMHLVPFAESIPGIKYPIIKKIFKKIIGSGNGFAAGKIPVLFEIPLSQNFEDLKSFKIISADKKKSAQNENILVGTPICFDDAFAEVCRALFLAGCEVFVNLTNDSWSKTASAEYQHFAVSSYRAIEYRTSVVRAANSGFSCVLDPTAKILDSLPIFTEDASCVSIPIFERTLTFYAKYGEWFSKCAMILIFAFCFYFSTTNFRKKN